jgi:undecaprenyl-diphosphatase
LSVIQGLTEFLPISSSAHLILMPKLTGLEDQGLAMDVALHMGSLGAVVVYFWSDVVRLFKGTLETALFKYTTSSKMVLMLALATVPVVVTGYLLHDVNGSLRNITVIAWASIGFGVLLYIFDKFCKKTKTVKNITYFDALVVGIGQAFALIPGASRSGTTMATLRMLGYTRPESAHYSCLMSIPTIIAAMTLTTFKLVQANGIAVTFELAIAAVISFVVSLASIFYMMRWLQHANYTIFVIYRVLLGIVLLAWVYF